MIHDERTDSIHLMQTVSNVAQSIFQAANEGQLDIIDITDPTTPTFYFDSVWRKIELDHETEMNYNIQSQLNN